MAADCYLYREGYRGMYTKIALDQMKNRIQELEQYEEKIESEYKIIVEIQYNLKHVQEKNLWEQIHEMERWSLYLYETIKRLKKYRFALEKIVDTYERCEEKIVDYEDQEKQSLVKYEIHDLSRLSKKMLEYHIRFQ